jgi:hypothetical protein
LGAAVVAAGVIALTLGAPTVASAQRAAPPPCQRFLNGTEAGVIADDGVVELSGIVASRAHPGVLWVHNDSGAPPEVFAISATGAALGRYRVDGAEAQDWEDIGIGPGPEAGRSYLYLADIGDNGSTRDHVTVYRAAEPKAEPDGTGGTLPLADALEIRYPGGPSDAESLFVDPVTGDLYVLTKRATGSRVLMATAAEVAAGGDISMKEVGAINTGSLVTAADISPDGSVVLVRTYPRLLAYHRVPGGTVASAMASEPCSAPVLQEQQGEAVGFSADGSAYFTASEGAAPALHRYGVSPPPLGPAPTTSTTATTTTTTTTEPAAPPTTSSADEDDDGSSSAPLIVAVAGVVVAVAALVTIVLFRRTRRGGRPSP